MRRTILAAMILIMILLIMPSFAIGKSADYLVFEPEYNKIRDRWDMWVLSYEKTSTKINQEKDTCVSAMNLSYMTGSEASESLKSLLRSPYFYDNGGPEASAKWGYMEYYSFSELNIPCYLESSGGDNTEVSPLGSVEITVRGKGRGGYSLTLIVKNSKFSPAYMLLCQMRRVAEKYQKTPSSIITYDYYTSRENERRLFSTRIEDYYSDQKKLLNYCESIIPESDGDTQIYYSNKEFDRFTISISPKYLTVFYSWK